MYTYFLSYTKTFHYRLCLSDGHISLSTVGIGFRLHNTANCMIINASAFYVSRVTHLFVLIARTICSFFLLRLLGNAGAGTAASTTLGFWPPTTLIAETVLSTRLPPSVSTNLSARISEYVAERITTGKGKGNYRIIQDNKNNCTDSSCHSSQLNWIPFYQNSIHATRPTNTEHSFRA